MFIGEKKVIVRKPHKCFACLRVMPPKTEMINWASIYDGNFCHGYTCLTCDEIMKILSRSKWYDSSEGFQEGFLKIEESPETILSKLLRKEDIYGIL